MLQHSLMQPNVLALLIALQKSSQGLREIIYVSTLSLMYHSSYIACHTSLPYLKVTQITFVLNQGGRKRMVFKYTRSNDPSEVFKPKRPPSYGDVKLPLDQY